MIIDEEAYVEHFGVKGMRWGVRKEKQAISKTGKSRKKKIIVGAAVGSAIVAGTLFAVKNQKLSQLSSVPNFKNKTAAGNKIVNDILKSNSDLRVRALAAHKAAKPSNDALKTIAARQLRSVNDANVKLKNWYNQSNTPIPKREYLDTGYWEKLVT